MADPVEAYLATLRTDLQGRIPPEVCSSVLDETRAHLDDLVSELGSAEAAVAKFGSARAFARRILRTATPVPNEWRAAILPFCVVLAVEMFFIWTPIEAFSRWVSQGSINPISTALWTGVALTMWGLYRARRVLIKPLLAFAVVHLAFFVLNLSVKGAPVMVDGYRVMSVDRQKGLAEFNRNVGNRLIELQNEQELLAMGIEVYRRARSARDVPNNLMLGKNGFNNPETIGASVLLEDRENGKLFSTGVLPFVSVESMGGVDDTFDAAAGSWSRDGERVRRRIEAEVRRYQEVLSLAPAAMEKPWWSGIRAHVPVAAKMSLRGTVQVLQWNIFTWLVWLLVSRFKLPRRRFATG